MDLQSGNANAISFVGTLLYMNRSLQ